MIETTSRALHRCMVLSVFQRERERERERETERERDRQRARETEREQRDRQTERDRERAERAAGKQRSSMVEILPVLENKKLIFDLSE